MRFVIYTRLWHAFRSFENSASSDISIIPLIKEFNSMVWKAKKEKSIALNAKIDGIKIPEELAEFSKDLKACHNLV